MGHGRRWYFISPCVYYLVHHRFRPYTQLLASRTCAIWLVYNTIWANFNLLTCLFFPIPPKGAEKLGDFIHSFIEVTLDPQPPLISLPQKASP